MVVWWLCSPIRQHEGNNLIIYLQAVVNKWLLYEGYRCLIFSPYPRHNPHFHPHPQGKRQRVEAREEGERRGVEAREEG